MALVLILTISGFRDGVFQRFVRLVNAIPLLRRLSGALSKHEENLHEMDHVVTDAYRNERGKFYLSLLMEYLCRACMGIEVYLILHSAGVDISIMSALFVYVVYSVIINLVFFVPLNLGVREGGLFVGLESLALAPVLGVYLGVVIRIREFIWILLGLLLIPLITRMESKEYAIPGEGRAERLP